MDGVADIVEEWVVDTEEVPVRVSDMEGDSSMLGEEDSDERMVNELVNDGCADTVSEAVMVVEELGEPTMEVEGLNVGPAVTDEDQEGPGLPDGVLVEEG